MSKQTEYQIIREKAVTITVSFTRTADPSAWLNLYDGAFVILNGEEATVLDSGSEESLLVRIVGRAPRRIPWSEIEELHIP